MHNIMQYVNYCRKTGKNFTDGAMAAVFRPLTSEFSVMAGFFRRLMMLSRDFAVLPRPFPSC